MTGGSGWPHLADAGDVVRWAEDRIEARHEFPRLLRSLINETNDQVVRNDMRAGKGVDVRGYDGIVEAQRPTPLVPSGLSVWELGTGADPTKKANGDYRERTDNPLGIDKKTATFVFATPRQWPEKQDWIKTKRADGEWANVMAFDVSDIEMALEAAPAAHIRFSEMVGKAAAGATTIEDWWGAFSTSTQPALTPELVLAGRADQAAELLRLIAQERRRTTIAAPSDDDVLAFCAATMLTTPEPDRSDLLARTLIVSDAISLRRLDTTANLLILLPFEESLRRAAELVRSNHVIFMTPGDVPADMALPPIDRDEFAAALRKAGVPEEAAGGLARAAHRSIVAFQREPSAGGTALRAWSAQVQDKVARRAWLVGSWNEARSGDTAVLTALMGISYEDARERLMPLATGEDPLFAIVGTTWALTAVDEAWHYGRAGVNDFDLRGLESAAQTVLGAVDPALELPPEERWTAGLYGKTRLHSSDLRGGIATTLAICGARGDDTRLGSGRTLATWAASIVAQLLRRANEDQSGQLWASLADVLPLLAEAAPDAFLRAVQEGVAGQDPVLRLIFTDQTGGFSISSAHTGLLWAMETVAWSDEFGPLAARLLARLAEIDPGGKLSNRPTNSLVGFFRPWLPQTSLPIERRLAVLDGLRRDHDAVAWDLMLALLPEDHAVGTYSHAPRFRTWKPEKEGVTNKEFWEFSSAVVARVREAADAMPGRWPEVVERLSDFSPPDRTETFDRLERLTDSELAEQDREATWAAIDKLIRHHRAFADAAWALPAEELERLEGIARRLLPTDPVAANRWLFDTHLPEIRTERGNYEQRQEEVASARAEAIRLMLDSHGSKSVLQLAETVSLPWFVGTATASQGTSDLDVEVLALLDSAQRSLATFAQGYCYGRARTEGWSWIEETIPRVTERPLAQSRLLQVDEDLPRAWRIAAELGEDVERHYWEEFSPLGHGQDFAYVNEAARGLLKHGRVITALDLMSMYSRQDVRVVDTDLIIEGLERLLQLPTDHPEPQRLSTFELGQLLDELRTADVDEDTLGLLEWRLLPALDHDARSPILERRLARSPAFFVEILSLCFRPRDGQTDPDTPEHVARNAYRLLSEWKIVPGSSERMAEVNEEMLSGWLTEARALLADVKRLEVGEIYIGHVFAHARPDEDGTWPTLPVRNAIERLASPEIESGFQTQTYNSRGVVSRGLLDGGAQERALAQKYRDYAAPIRDQWPRTAAALQSLADGYESEARRHDEESERFREGLDS